MTPPPDDLRARPVVAVIGGAVCTPQQADWAAAVGRGIAERGAVVICGGRGGVMEAACRGAKTGGGLTIGVLPGTSREAANPHVDVVIASGVGEARNAIIINSADAAIAVGGEYGTLSEIAFALKRGLPVAGLGTWELSQAGEPDEAIYRAATPVEAVDWVLDRVGEKQA